MDGLAGLQSFFAAETDDPLRHAFAARPVIIPRSRGTPVAADAVGETWRAIAATPPAAAPAVAYIHIPFCSSRCSFCGFYRHRAEAEIMAEYVARLCAEIERDGANAYAQGRSVTAVYFGGGTPSLLDADSLHRLLGTVRRVLPLSDDCEITVEARVRHFGRDKAEACLAAGANRISVGVQTFDTALRRRHGRAATRDEVVAQLEMLLALGGAAVVCDLIFGFPEQSPDQWQADLATCVALGLDGVDLYNLSRIPGTPLAVAVERGTSPPPLPMSERGAFYAAGARAFAEAGWRQISNNHWGRTARERNRYNLHVKSGSDCLAFGSGAGGHAAGFSWSIEGDLARYGEAVARGEKPVRGLVRADEDPALRRLAADLEEGRVDLGALGTRCGAAASERMRLLLGQWSRAGLVALRGGGAALTLAGRFWATNLQAGLAAALAQSPPHHTPPARKPCPTPPLTA